ncbi:AAA family ATPase [Aneurinibacillus thermoaerophilus]|uniref:AAA family ATPase n=1 Tax=Aneurinibacillus thermoaerophilus TaxID=143495 RepID=UPI002E244B96|nr:AAA family ATPase [Aneurinibacillus thermoaerophilus]MED0763775.1 AAA family ATPase [Aneurinibacillus thermoaerophilus]
MITPMDEPDFEAYVLSSSTSRESSLLFEEDENMEPDDPVPLSQRAQKVVSEEVNPQNEEHGREESPRFIFEHEPVSSVSMPPSGLWNQKESETPVSAELARYAPSVFAAYAAKGGVGTTTFLLHLAEKLAREGGRVCILDLDLMHGSVASTLQLQPNKTIADLVRRIEDVKASQACLLETRMGFFIVAAPAQAGTLVLEREQLIAVVRFLKSEMDTVLIDTPVHFDTITKLALEQAEQLCLITTDEPASIRNLGRMKPFLSALYPSPDIAVVWNRMREKIPKDRLRELLPWPNALDLPEDEAVGEAVRRGECATKGPYAARIHAFVDRYWFGKGIHEEPRWNRFFRFKRF